MAAAGLRPGAALAATATQTNVAGITMVVPAKCQIAATPLLATVHADRAITAKSTVSISCTTTTLFNVRLDSVGRVPPGAAGKPFSVLTGVPAYALTVGPAVKVGERKAGGGADAAFGIGAQAPMILTVGTHTVQEAPAKPEDNASVVTVTFIF